MISILFVKIGALSAGPNCSTGVKRATATVIQMETPEIMIELEGEGRLNPFPCALRTKIEPVGSVEVGTAEKKNRTTYLACG